MLSELADSNSITKSIVILNWDRRYKGNADALLNDAKIGELSLAEWILSLPNENRRIIEQIYTEAAKQFILS